MIAMIVGVSSFAEAGAFGAGNLAVYRVGDGQSYANGVAAPVFVDEYTPSGTLVQSIPMPTTATGNQLGFTGRYGGGETEEGLLTVSTDGRYLVLPGYSSAVGTTNVTGSAVSGTTNQRVLGRIDNAGNIDTSTGLGNLYSAAQFVSAASTDGSSIWVSGKFGPGIGVNYTQFGSGTFANVIGEPAPGNNAVNHQTRGIGIWGGDLFVTTGTNNRPVSPMTVVYQVGTGLPTTGQAAAITLSGVNPPAGTPATMALFDVNAQVPGLDVMYYTNMGGDAFRKYSKQADNTWLASGTIPAGNQDWHGLTGIVVGNDVQLYATKLNSELTSLLDTTGHNGDFSALAPTTIATAAEGTYFRGVTFAPSVPEPASLALVAFGALSLGVVRRGRQ
ncbi:MAG: PEP-CTERM sorting domain-containing protein [Lacipirellulaceae bacterium]